jgi:transposase-like protein
MKFDSEIVSHALDLYFNGVSLRKIEHHFRQTRGLKVDHSTIYKWIKKFIKIVSEYVDSLNPDVGNVWHSDEMMVKVREGGVKNYGRGKSRYVWLWNCMDADTRFLLANQVTKKRDVAEVRKLFKHSKEVGGSKPEYVITDGLPAYLKGFKREFYTSKKPRVEHIVGVGITDKIPNNKVERLNGTVRQREKVMRGMQNHETSNELMNGYRARYNFVRPHIALDGKTPAEEAKINLELGNNKWKGLIEKAIENQAPQTVKIKEKTRSKGKLDYWF